MNKVYLHFSLQLNVPHLFPFDLVIPSMLGVILQENCHKDDQILLKMIWPEYGRKGGNYGNSTSAFILGSCPLGTPEEYKVICVQNVVNPFMSGGLLDRGCLDL